ncbi:DUF1850 domain-containing protein [Burkholderiaceae bacterium FT117]|uniref:DUF1850 domain-containing protein n=1 Tax=Zeimonas sediminis TaxID=2944268 RepID=UPI002342C063|nr:DUF1850 domain-containing protein [Zeimonas sediminis]MCM5568887.1 DUF1850 domain-containing protein [Zeimonas sediminis]
MTIGLCLAVATTIVASLPVDRFTLDWIHSIEKVRWEEDWRIDPARRTLRLVESRLRGSGAGMEPPEGAVLRDGVWHASGTGLEVSRLRLALSDYTDDWRLCTRQGCRPLRAYVPRSTSGTPATGTIELLPCRTGRPDRPQRRG